MATLDTLRSLREQAQATQAAHFAAPSFEAGNWAAVTAAWRAYREAARASNLPRPQPRRGLRFESAYWVDYSIEPAACVITRIDAGAIIYRLLDCRGAPTGARYSTPLENWPQSALPEALS